MTEHPHDTEERAQARRVALIRAAVVRASGDRRPASGVMSCPACDTGEVFYSVWRAGGIHATCTTPGCCERWLE